VEVTRAGRGVSGFVFGSTAGSARLEPACRSGIVSADEPECSTSIATGAQGVESGPGRGEPQTSQAGPGGENKPHQAQATCAGGSVSWGEWAPGSGRASSPTEVWFGLSAGGHEPLGR
jgi:hypothetical protein